ncbi:MAG: hypothetical protein JEZ02_18290 [Desulfatibacillum sp.]|nr:hypothetical protein [Desulfatibacillum sp.]
MKYALSMVFAIIVLLTFTPATLAGPYAPAAGQAGSTAVSKDDASIKGWATGYTNLVYGSNVDPAYQTPEKALGAATGAVRDIVCLGRGGRITLTFSPNIIFNGEGPDLTIFENSEIPGFLELAYVEVSSDGVNFVRFPNDSLTPNSVGAFATIDPTNIDGLASKYRVGYGTPFDLNSLITSTAVLSNTVDLDRITHVRLIDVVGDGTCLDTTGDPIYDPYPTTGSAGFDLEAAGYMHYYLAGDLNLDDQLTMADAILALQILAGIPVENVSNLRDRDGDGKISLVEALGALSYLVNSQ